MLQPQPSGIRGPADLSASQGGEGGATDMG